ncbi:hypothetical protein S83_055255 [Arachis hypogaea]
MSAFDTYSVDSDHHQNHADEDNFSGYGGYSNFSGGNVPVVDHTSPSASPDIFGFSDLDPSYSQSPFELVHVAENGNDNRYHDSIFVSDESVLPAPTEMRSEESYALQEKEAVEEEAETSRSENGGSMMLMAMVVARNESGGRDAEFGIGEEKMGNKIIN